jgi:hypothetical protein
MLVWPALSAMRFISLSKTVFPTPRSPVSSMLFSERPFKNSGVKHLGLHNKLLPTNQLRRR